jgi:glycosyltransferase involved in cell wall biosynthesis
MSDGTSSAGRSYSEPPVAPMRIALLIDRLDRGGSERQFIALATALRHRGHAVVALVFYPDGALEPELRAGGVDIRLLHKNGRWDVVRFVWRLIRVLRQERPRVLHGYSGVPNVLTVLVRPFVPGLKIIWGVRASNMPLHLYGRLPAILNRVGVALSRYPDLIIANSFAGREHVVSRGYPRSKVTVIPNGIDTNRFAPRPETGRRIRAEWNVPEGQKLVGLVGRVDPAKGHDTFLGAAALLAQRRPDLQFVCVGDGPCSRRQTVQRLGAELGLDGRVLWVSDHTDVPGVYNALDVFCCASDSEGFPNVVGEAMACGVPCVVTNAGDSAWILGQPRFTVQPGDARGLADRVEVLLNTPPQEIARMTSASRQRVVDLFSIGNLARATERAIAPLLEERAH